jgi:hypothetical protein
MVLVKGQRNLAAAPIRENLRQGSTFVILPTSADILPKEIASSMVAGQSRWLLEAAAERIQVSWRYT